MSLRGNGKKGRRTPQAPRSVQVFLAQLLIDDHDFVVVGIGVCLEPDLKKVQSSGELILHRRECFRYSSGSLRCSTETVDSLAAVPSAGCLDRGVSMLLGVSRLSWAFV